MSSSFVASLRATSPITEILSAGNGKFSTATAVDRRNLRATALATANTVDEVITMIPSDYREVLRAPLNGIKLTTERLMSARSTLSKWEAHFRAGTFPTFLSAKSPNIVLSRAYLESEAGAAHQRAIKDAHQAYLVLELENSIKAKKDDVAFLSAALEMERLQEQLFPIVEQRSAALTVDAKLPVYRNDIDGNVFLDRWEDNPALASLAAEMRGDVAMFANRVIRVTESRLLLQEQKAAKKKAIKVDADAEMADGTNASTAGPSMQDIVDKAVAAALKKAKKAPADVSKIHSEKCAYYLTTFSEKEEIGKEIFESRQKRLKAPPSKSREARSEGHRSCGQEAEKSGQIEEGYEGQGKGQVAGTIRFRYDDPNTYPDCWLTIPHPKAVGLLISNTPLYVLEAARFRNNIHLSSDVVVPLELQMQLSVGLKYMFPTKRNEQLILSAYNDFEERLRWRLFFEFEGSIKNPSYDPDYEVPHVRTKKPPRAPGYIEKGLELGKVMVHNAMHVIRTSNVERGQIKSLIPSTASIKKFLLDNDLIVTGTDKNLGIAVSKRTWIIEKSLDILSNTNDYSEITFDEMKNEQDIKYGKAVFLDTYAKNNLVNGKQIGTFVSHLIPDNPDLEFPIPLFFGIPKIHKTPTKLRPIIPCHKAVQNPAAKYVSKVLKPVVAQEPTIINGTKELAIKLSSCKINTSRRYWIVTGDVVAFYPNIELDKCLSIVGNLYEQYLGTLDFPILDRLLPEEMRYKFHLAYYLRQCLEFSSKKLLLQYNNKYYLQKRGLAMGVACSPDLANLYGAHFEQKCNILEDPNIIFYGRYIDDCLALVYADTADQALKTVQKVKFDGCTIEWNVSDSSAVFLDMLLFKDEEFNLQHKVYKKLRSHSERIPFISHHPLDVKRGTFIGEVSRMATLCSRLIDYNDSINALCALYVTRGYPSTLISSWRKKYVTKGWENRLKPKINDAPNVLVLKTEYNTCWNYLNATSLGDTIMSYWREWLNHADQMTFDADHPRALSRYDYEGIPVSLLHDRISVPDLRKIGMTDRRFIASRKRTLNMFDLTNIWKNQLITLMDEDALMDQVNKDIENIYQAMEL